MSTEKKPPKLIDSRTLKAQSHPIRAHILNILSEGPSSPGRMHRRMENVSLSLVCHHVKILREVGLIELVEIRQNGCRREHVYRATGRQFFDLEEWLAIEPKFRDPITTDVLRQVSEDTGRSAAEGKINERPDRHVSRSPVEVDDLGWVEVVDALEIALNAVLEAHARSAERRANGGGERISARVVILQYPIGAEGRDENEGEPG